MHVSVVLGDVDLPRPHSTCAGYLVSLPAGTLSGDPAYQRALT